LAVGGGIALAARAGRTGAAWPWRLGAVVAGLAGTVLVWMVLASDHQDTAGNFTLLLLHPFWWLLLVPLAARWRDRLRLTLTVCVLIGTLVLAWPGLVQDRPALLGLLVPILLAVLWSSGRSPARPSLKPS
jgi:peptidoglycan/LPS O-acetylase OafA/YrhL